MVARALVPFFVEGTSNISKVGRSYPATNASGTFPKNLFCASFFPFFSPVHPTLPRAIFFPKIPSFWHLRSTLSRREKATCRGWVLGTVLDGVAPQGKKGKSFFSGARKKVGFPKNLLRTTELALKVISIF